MNKYIESVLHLKKKLEKGVSYEKTLHILHKLQKIPISIELLQVTGIGKTVRNLSKQNDSDIGKTAKLLCLTWKAIVKEQQEREQEDDHNSNEAYGESSQSSPVTEEPDFDNSNEHKLSTSFNIKSEHKSHYSEENTSNRESKSKRRNHDEEDKYHDSPSDKKLSKSSHKKHKSSHKSKDKNPKTEFETLLELNDEIIRTNSKKYDERSKAKDVSIGKNHCSDSFPTGLDPKNKLKLEKIDILSSLPTPHYKPLPNRELIDEKVEANRRKTIKSAEDLSLRVQSRKGRTAVFAGHARTNVYTHVHSLEELCIRVLMDNIEKLCCLGDAPYYLIKSVLQKCNAKQLSKIERYNPQLMDETDELWEEFCKKEFRGREPDEDEDESWRQLYYRCVKERDDKLKYITKHIVRKQAKAVPVRQTIVSDTPKTPREILRKQERAANHSNSSHRNGHVSNSSSNHVRIVPEKPKVAPLMKKALKLQKARFRR